VTEVKEWLARKRERKKEKGKVKGVGKEWAGI